MYCNKHCVDAEVQISFTEDLLAASQSSTRSIFVSEALVFFGFCGKKDMHAYIRFFPEMSFVREEPAVGLSRLMAAGPCISPSHA